MRIVFIAMQCVESIVWRSGSGVGDSRTDMWLSESWIPTDGNIVVLWSLYGDYRTVFGLLPDCWNVAEQSARRGFGLLYTQVTRIHQSPLTNQVTRFLLVKSGPTQWPKPWRMKRQSSVTETNKQLCSWCNDRSSHHHLDIWFFYSPSNSLQPIHLASPHSLAKPIFPRDNPQQGKPLTRPSSGPFHLGIAVQVYDVTLSWRNSTY
jgi:hypothetical protein